MSSGSDYKTKDFLEKIDALIERGIIKNHAEVVSALNWNKSVMSSVKNGTLPVPQHIYNKFKTTYADEIALLYQSDTPAQEYKDKYIALLEDYNKVLLKEKDDLTKLATDIAQDLSEAKQNQYIVFSVLQAFQEFWVEHVPLKGMTKESALEIIGEKAARSLLNLQHKGMRL